MNWDVDVHCTSADAVDAFYTQAWSSILKGVTLKATIEEVFVHIYAPISISYQ